MCIIRTGKIYWSCKKKKKNYLYAIPFRSCLIAKSPTTALLHCQTFYPVSGFCQQVLVVFNFFFFLWTEPCFNRKYTEIVWIFCTRWSVKTHNIVRALVQKVLNVYFVINHFRTPLRKLCSVFRTKKFYLCSKTVLLGNKKF